MSKLKQRKFIWFGIILLGVILLGIPATIYAHDEPVGNEWVGSSDGEVGSNANSDVPDFKLGSSTEDFVFTPVTPCRIVNTWNAGGPLATNETRSFLVHGTGAQLAAQGGSPAGCPSPVGEPLGVLINVTVVDTTASGYLSAWPYGESMPLPRTSILNYKPNGSDPICNALALKTGVNKAKDINVYAYKGTDLIIDVLGYFSRPEKTPLQIYRAYVRKWIVGGWGTCIAWCPSGYSLTGGGCNTMSNVMPVQISYPLYEDEVGWRCGATNETMTSYWIDCHAICARIPGR